MSTAEIKVDSFSHNRNLAKIKKEEEELEALLRGDAVNEEEEQEAEPAAEEPSSDVAAESEPEDAGDSKQEEAPQAEAQEDDVGLSAEEANFKKRYGDLRRHQQAKEAEYKKRLEALEAQLKDRGVVDPAASKEQIQAWAKQNPQAEKLMRALVDDQAESKLSDIDRRLAAVEQMEAQAKKRKAEAELMSIHPDFETIRGDDAFHAWAKEQPEVMQVALYDNPEDVKGVARVLDLYKADKGIKTKRQASADNSAAKSVRARSAAKPEADESKSFLSESIVAKMSAKEFEKRFEEIIEAQKSGKFVYDLSKPGR